MKRSWMGAGLLAALLVLGLASSFYMQRCYEPMSRDVRWASELAASGDWQEARDYVNRVEKRWKGQWGFAASFADHEPMERINGLFAQLETCAQMEAGSLYALLCAQLAEEIAAIGEAHSLTWWNLL